MNTDTYKEIMNLSRMTVGELREKYLEVFGEETRSPHKDFLRKRIAWRLQAFAEGDLSERDRSVRGRLPASRDRRLVLPGTLLVREYKGQSVVVKVLDEGFEYEGRRYKSLSAIAREVTGTKWNGFLFFGLADDGTPASGTSAPSPPF